MLKHLRALIVSLTLIVLWTASAHAAASGAIVCTGVSTNFQSVTCPDINDEITNLDRQGIRLLTSVLGTNTITANASPYALTSYQDGQTFRLKPTNNNTSTVTLSINSIGAKAIVKQSGTALASGDLSSTTIYLLQYYASDDHFRVMGAVGTPGVDDDIPESGDFTNLTGGSGIDNNAGTLDLDLTEISSATYGAGAFTSLTFNAGAVDPVITFGSGTVTWSAVTTFNLDDEAELRLFEEDAGGANYIGFKAPAAVTSNVTCTFENDANPIPDSCVGNGTDDTGALADADYGDITVSGSGLIWNLDADVVTPTELAEAGAYDFTGTVTLDSDALRLDDTNASHQLIITPGSDLTANRVFTLTTGDAARTLTLTDNVSLGDADLGDITASSDFTVLTIDADSVALGTDTTNVYVAQVADGTGIDGTANAEGATYTPTLDLTELSTFTLGAGAATGIIFDAGATDPAIEVASGTWTIDIGGTNETTLTASNFSPGVDGGNILGSGTLQWAGLFSSGDISFGNGDVVIDYSSNDLAFTGVTGDYSFDDTVGVTGSVTASVDVTATAGDVTSGDDLIAGDDLLLSNAGVINFNAGDCTLTEGTDTLTIAGTCVLITEDAGLQVGASVPFSDSAGSLTLQNVDTLDATTETTIEAAIDTTANLVSIQGRTVTLADAGQNAFFGWDDVASAYENLTDAEAETIIEPLIDTTANLVSIQGRTVTLSDAGFDAIFGWDDSANAYKTLLLADIATEATPAAGDFVYLIGAEGDLRKVNWSDLPGAGAGVDNFLDLTDTPDDYTTFAGDCVKVNGTEDGLEFDSCAAGTGDDLGNHTATEDLKMTTFDIDFGTGDIKIDYTANSLAFTGATGDYSFDDTVGVTGSVTASVDVTATAGDLTSGDDVIVGDDLTLATGAVINWNAGDLTLTHSANTLTLTGGSFVVDGAGLTVGASVPFSDTAGTLTLQNVDAIDATTESTIEATLDTLTNVTSIGGDVTAGGDFISTDDLISGDDVLLSNAGVINFNAGDCTLTEGTDTLTIAGTCVLVTENAGLQIGSSVPFSDSAGTLTLQNIDAIDATTETTLEAAIDLADLADNYVAAVADGTGIDGTASGVGTTYTPTLDLTEINTFTLGAGAATGIIFDAGASDPAIEVATGVFRIDIGGTDELSLNATNLSPGANDGNALGVSGTAWADLFLAAGGLVEMDGGTTNSFTCTSGSCTIEGNTMYRAGGTDVALADGGTGASLADPGGNRIVAWDDTANAVEFQDAGTGLTAGTSTLDCDTPTESAVGCVENATTAEAEAGSDDVRFMTPADTLAAVTGKKPIWIPGGSVIPRTTNGCAVADLELATNDIMMRTCNYDTTTEEGSGFTIRMPDTWDEGTFTVVPVWTHPATTTNFGVVWGFSCLATSNDDAQDAALGSQVTSTDTGGTTSDQYTGPATAAMTCSGTPAAGDTIYIEAERVVGNGSDTMAVDAYLLGYTIYYTDNAYVEP